MPAETFADEVDCSRGGQKPAYVLGRLCSTYAGVLQLVTQLVEPPDEPADPFSVWVKQLSEPSSRGAMDWAQAD